MTRPIYETTEDRAHESRGAQRLGIYWGAVPKQLPPLYPCDIAMVDPTDDVTIVGWVEYKQRNCMPDTYPDIMLSLHKVLKLRELGQQTAKPIYFSVGFNDGSVYYVNVKYIPVTNPRLGGRTQNTRDHGDIEPVIHIPMNLFKKV